LQRLMAETGLYRQQSSGGEVWRWRQKPRQPWTIEWRECSMPTPEEVSYRLRLVLGFLEEARQDFNLERWRCWDQWGARTIPLRY